jgi:hypothetical protein
MFDVDDGLLARARTQLALKEQQEIAVELSRRYRTASARGQWVRAGRLMDALGELAAREDVTEAIRAIHMEALLGTRFSADVPSEADLDALLDFLGLSIGNIFGESESKGRQALEVLRAIVERENPNVKASNALADGLNQALFALQLNGTDWQLQQELLHELEQVATAAEATSEQQEAFVESLAYQVLGCAGRSDDRRGRALLSKLATFLAVAEPIDTPLAQSVYWLSQALVGVASEVDQAMEFAVLTQIRALAEREAATVVERDCYAEALESCLHRGEELDDEIRVLRLLDELRRIGNRPQATIGERTHLARALYNRHHHLGITSAGEAILAELDALARDEGYAGPLQDELLLAIGNTHYEAWMGDDAELVACAKSRIAEHLRRPSATSDHQLQMAKILLREAESSIDLAEVHDVVSSFGQLVSNALSSEAQMDLYVSALCELRQRAQEAASFQDVRRARDEIRRIAGRECATERQIEIARSLGVGPPL